MINYRQLTKNDDNFFKNLISYEGNYYDDFLSMGWSKNQIINQINKKTNLSFGAFYNENLVSFILGDLFNIEKMSEYEILLIYVSKHFRKKGLGTKLLNKIEENNICLKKIYLEVSKNNSEGILFYTKMKFIKIRTRKNYFFIKNKYIDALVMVKTY
ncbi:GNAT family N-acetyltransferase [Pelagibacterales bacterium SAG-MED31]|nr:GNAT family N-acetyltransferase [Pelagibacterales bacterium SAG-MED31]